MTNPSDPTPERPGMGEGEAPAHPGSPREEEAAETDGQVSEASDMSDAGQPISDGDTVYSNPTDESGDTDEGVAGPNADYHPGARNT